MNIYRAGAIAAVFTLLVVGAAEATPITYTFTGTGAGSVGGTGGNNGSSGIPFVAETGGTSVTTFTVTLTGDTSTVTSGGGQLRNDNLTATFVAGGTSGTFSLTGHVDETLASQIIIFGEDQPSPVFFVGEGLSNPVFGTYDLASALSSTSGSPSVIPQIFSTSAGNLEFDRISSISFQAVTGAAAVPEPASLLLFGTALVGLAGRLHKRGRI